MNVASISTVNLNTVLCVSCCTRELLLHVQRHALELPDFQALFAFPGIATVNLHSKRDSQQT